MEYRASVAPALAIQLDEQVRRPVDHQVLLDEVLRGIHAAEHFQQAQAIECAMGVPHRSQNLLRAIAGSLIALLRGHPGP